MDISPGRAAIWRARGRNEQIQIAVVYLHTGISGGRAERRGVLKQIVGEMGKDEGALNILLGDFNFVTKEEDRVGGDEMAFTRSHDKQEAQDAESILEAANLARVEQNSHSWLDRVYTNMRRLEWLDRNISCVALERKDDLSRHRAILAYRRTPQRQEQDYTPLDAASIGGEDWARRVKLEYIQNLQAKRESTTGVQRLLILKQAIRKVMQQCAKEVNDQTNTKTISASCKLTQVMRYIRAVEGQNWNGAAKASRIFEDLGNKFKRRSDSELANDDLKQIHEWALTLARGNITEEIDQLRKLRENGEQLDERRQRENIIRKLNRVRGSTRGRHKRDERQNWQRTYIARSLG